MITHSIADLTCFPRTRGDEPSLVVAIGSQRAFSPHTRG